MEIMTKQSAFVLILIWSILSLLRTVAPSGHAPRDISITRTNDKHGRRTEFLTSGNNNPFKVIVLAGKEPSCLQRLLKSIASADYSNTASLTILDVEIRLEGIDPQKKVLSELIATGFELPPYISRTVTVCASGNDSENVSDTPGGLYSWFDAWPEADGTNPAIILDENVELSPLWYKYLTHAWAMYGQDDGDHNIMAGISLMPQLITSSVRTPMNPTSIVNKHQPFLYPMVTGPGNAFSPHPQRWRAFLTWVEELKSALDTTVLPPTLASALLHVKDYDEIFFYHTRKAAGIMVQLFLRQLAKRHGKKFTALEGRLCPSKYMHYDDMPEASTYLENPRVLTVTTLRDPSERAISNYFYGGRWKATDKVMDPSNEIDFDTWLDDKLIKRTPCNNSGRRWKCASQCFARWFGGDGRGGYDVANAIEVLQSFDLVMHTDDLQNESYRRMIELMLDADRGSFDVAHKTDPKRKEGVIFTPGQMERLQSVNIDDERIVEAVTGKGRSSNSTCMTKVVMRSFLDDLMDEEKSWTKWTQLFTYWCHLNDYSAMHVSLPHGRVLGRVVRQEENIGSLHEFELLSALDNFEFSWPKELVRFDLNGTNLDGAFTTQPAQTQLQNENLSA